MDAYIYDAVRSPRGSTRKDGSLQHVAPIELVKQLLQALNARNNEQLYPHIEDVILGCVTQTKHQGANIAKTAVTYTGLPFSTSGMTVNRFCTSGLDAITIAASKVHSGFQNIVVAGGVESVSNVPMFSDEGHWFSNAEVSEQTKFLHMGISADLIAQLNDISRSALDAYAVRSHTLAAKAQQQERFKRSIVPIKTKEQTLFSTDELIRPNCSVEALSQLTPSFGQFLTRKQKTFISEAFKELNELSHQHHVGNSPSLADGGSLLVIGNKEAEKTLNRKPIAKIVGAVSLATNPLLLLGGQVAAETLLKKCNLSLEEIDVIEFYEAYAATAVKAMNDWQIDASKFNPNGGVIATGHALGATGAMMTCSLLDELANRNGRYGVVTLSGGGGVGTAMVVEM